MIKYACYAGLALWAFLVLRRWWREAGDVVDARWANRSPYFNRNDP